MEQIRFLEEEEKIKICALTGHRELGEDFSESALKKALKALIERGADTFLCGMAIGFDLIAAETVLKLKKKYPHIKLVACIPCLGQDRYFSEKDKKRYAQACEKADEKKVFSEHYFNGCMHIRDKYMAENADVMLAYCKREKGGTAYTVACFRKKHPQKELILL